MYNSLSTSTTSRPRSTPPRIDCGRAGMDDAVEDAQTCCYASQNKVWSSDPQGLRWEWYRIIEDAETFGSDPNEANAAEAP